MPASTDIKRIYVEKKPGFDQEAHHLLADFAEFLAPAHPDVSNVSGFRVLHRYDAQGLDEAAFRAAVAAVFSEPQCDFAFDALPPDSLGPRFAVEYLPGQFDQRADSAEQCVELAAGVRPRVRCARVYLLETSAPLSEKTLGAIKKYFINPVDSREASLELPASLEQDGAAPAAVPRLAGFRDADGAALSALAASYGLAMSAEDLRFCRDHFRAEGRDPSLAELRVLDTYWSDHCRHSTFTTSLDSIEIADGPDAEALRRAQALYEAARAEVYGAKAESRPRTLMDLATIGAKALRKRGLLDDLEESAEINACSIRVKAKLEDGSEEPWLLMFKNETHNHPTEIEPFGGAATCLGGAIRDPLSGRAFVHQAMRVSGAADPRAPLSQTLPGKLPQLKLVREAAAGYASYGNQIGLATGQVSEFYHPGFLAKRMELGAVIGAAPEAWVRRDEPAEGDLVLLVGGRTGRDGIGGATGSSKEHTDESVASAGAEVQKGNAVEERKIQRLFRNPEVTRLIKRCNDFGAGGVAVAVGELAPGLEIDLDAVPKKYAGLDGVELAISESQERMAVVVAPADAAAFEAASAAENLTAVVVARVSGNGRLRMTWNGDRVVDLERAFLDTNGASRSANVVAAPETQAAPAGTEGEAPSASVVIDRIERELRSLRGGSRRGLQERFDGSIGSASVLFPWGGADQGTPECGMAAKLPALDEPARTASLMTFGYDPELASRSPYRGAKAAVLEALAKFACLGGDPLTARLSLQEYFEKPQGPESWGKPFQALLGALEAQLGLGVGAIGGKDSMSGTFRDPGTGRILTVPPTLVAFAAGSADSADLRSGALSGKAGNTVVLFVQGAESGDGEWDAFKANTGALGALAALGAVSSAYPVGSGGSAAALALAAFGNAAGVEYDMSGSEAFPPAGSFIAELDGAVLEAKAEGVAAAMEGAYKVLRIARTIEEPIFRVADTAAILGREVEDTASLVAEAPLAVLRRAYEYPLARVFPQTSTGATAADDPDVFGAGGPLVLPAAKAAPYRRKAPRASGAAPLVVVPAFPGTNCEWDMARAFRRAGARTKIVVFRNRNRDDVLASTRDLAAAVAEAQIVALPGGFSAGDEPDGSGKFIANAFRAPLVREQVEKLLRDRDGLMLGICNGFQALIKLGLVPYGEYRDADGSMPTLTYNAIGRHVSRMARTRVMSLSSPWLTLEKAGEIHVVPVSHGEGRLAVEKAQGEALFEAGQVPFCYVDSDGNPTMAEPDNPNGSAFAAEALCSPDGRVLGKMGHSERCGPNVHKNIPGAKEQRIFEAGVAYFR